MLSSFSVSCHLSLSTAFSAFLASSCDHFLLLPFYVVKLLCFLPLVTFHGFLGLSRVQLRSFSSSAILCCQASLFLATCHFPRLSRPFSRPAAIIFFFCHSMLSSFSVSCHLSLSTAFSAF